MIVSKYEGQTLSISGNGIVREFSTHSDPDKLTTIPLLKEWLKNLPDEERVRILNELEKMAPASLIQKNDLMMTWDQARAMSKTGIEFGAHTVSHPILSKTGDKELEKEILESKQRIEEMTGQPVSLFAYPNGEAGDFDQRAIDLLKTSGFIAACSTIYGVNNGIKAPFVLKRIPAFRQPLSSFGCRLVGYK